VDFAEVLLNRDDIEPRPTRSSTFSGTGCWGGRSTTLRNAHTGRDVADLERLFRSIFDGLELTGRSDTWRTHHIATIAARFRTPLLNISTACKDSSPTTVRRATSPGARSRTGRCTSSTSPTSIRWGQDLVFAARLRSCAKHLERRDLGVDAVIVFVDESTSTRRATPETYVKKMLLDISERGRYLGLVLFAAEQFARRCIAASWGTQGHRCSGAWT